VARAIHLHSPRRLRPFVEVNCAALPGELVESELFGHERGAFTGAVELRRGKFEQADGGTLFFDEIGDMSPRTQGTLLRVLESQSFERVGGSKPLQVNVRVIAATNRRLEDLIAAGLFREDLFYRLAVVSLHVPPLRERRGDIPLLAEHFLRGFCAHSGLHAKRFEPSALAALADHSWPGNVRELRNCVERLVMMVTGERIEAADLDLPLRAAPAPTGRAVPCAGQPQRSRLLAALDAPEVDPPH
jgi:two-component system nitrogen regulation response regulator NtrX